jgi:GABA(A) receptor-associated protein
MNFRTTYTFEKRSREAKTILTQYPDRIPVIVEVSNSEKFLPALDKAKYLVPQDFTVGGFIHVIRGRMKLDPAIAIFLFANEKVLPPTTQMMISCYQMNRNRDGFLYFTLHSENTFGLSTSVAFGLLDEVP